MPAHLLAGSAQAVAVALGSLLATGSAAAPCPVVAADAVLAEGREHVYWFEIWDGTDQDRALEELEAYIRTLRSLSALLDDPACSADPAARHMAHAATLSLRSAYRQLRFVARVER